MEKAPKPQGTARQHQFAVRMTEGELEHLQQAAAACAMPVADYARKRLLGHRPKASSKIVDARALHELNRVALAFDRLVDAVEEDPTLVPREDLSEGIEAVIASIHTLLVPETEDAA